LLTNPTLFDFKKQFIYNDNVSDYAKMHFLTIFIGENITAQVLFCGKVILKGSYL